MRPGSEEYLDSEKYQLRPRDWAAAERRGPHAGAATSPGSTDPARAPRPAAAAQPALPPQPTASRSSCYSQAATRRRHRPRASSTSTRTTPGRPRCASTCRRSASSWDDALRRCTTSSPARPISWGRTTTCAWTRSTSPRTCSRRRCDRHRRPERSPTVIVNEPRTATAFADTPDRGPRPRLVQARRLLRGPRALLPGQQRRRHRRPAGPHRQARLPAVAGRRLPLAAAVLRVAAARRRLRRLRLHRRAARVRRPRRLRRVRRRRARARHARDHRLRHEPHQRPAPVVPGSPAATPTGRTATSTSGPTTTSSTRTRGSSSSTPRRPTGPSTRCASSTSGTASSPTSPTSTSRTPASQEEIIEALRFWLDLGIDGFRLDAVPVPVRGGGHQLREPPGAPTSSSSGCARRSTRTTRTRVLLAEANQWPEDVVDYFGDSGTGGDECHMAFHFPVMPRHLHGGTARVALPGLRDPGEDPGDPRRTASGASSCATTTS